MKTVLEIVNTELNSIDIPYAFMRWNFNCPDVYFVGECSEVPAVTEDGAKEYTMILTGTIVTIDGTWGELDQFREKIENHFPSVYGLRKSKGNVAVVIMYENSFPVPTGEANLKRIQINLRIKEWKGAM